MQWADRISDFPSQTKLEWLLQQKRYKAFIMQGDKALKQEPKNDSLRTFFGQQLMYEGFYEEGYARLYPLFKKKKAPKSTQKLVHTEISYQSYHQQKQFYKRYPAFFSDSLRKVLQGQYRSQQAVSLGLTTDYASDNFSNTIGRLGGFTEWGNRQKFIHRIFTEKIRVGSDTTGKNTRNLTHAGYSYQHKWPGKGTQVGFTGGIYYGDRVRPEAQVTYGHGVDSSYTALQFDLNPVFTTTALKENISKLELEAYREDFWFDNELQTSGAFTGRRFSNNVYSYEALGKVYLQLPFSTQHHRIRTAGEFSYSDATTSYSSGVPYYTPDQLFIEGAGLDYRYMDVLQNPACSLELELMAKHDSQDGIFGTFSAHLNARIYHYWQLSLDADVSSSAVYRYNHVGLTLSYLFPRHL